MMVKRNWGDKHSDIIQNARTLIRQDPITGAYHTVDPKLATLREATLTADKNPNYQVEAGALRALGDQQADMLEMRGLAQYTYGLKYDYADKTQDKIDKALAADQSIQIDKKLAAMNVHIEQSKHKLPLYR